MTEKKLAGMTTLNEKIKSCKKILENLKKPNHSILVSNRLLMSYNSTHEKHSHKAKTSG